MEKAMMRHVLASLLPLLALALAGTATAQELDPPPCPGDAPDGGFVDDSVCKCTGVAGGYSTKTQVVTQYYSGSTGIPETWLSHVSEQLFGIEVGVNITSGTFDFRPGYNDHLAPNGTGDRDANLITDLDNYSCAWALDATSPNSVNAGVEKRRRKLHVPQQFLE